MRTYGQQTLRGLGATIFLGLLGTAAALVPVDIFSLISSGEPAHWTLYVGASLIGGAAIGWVLRR